MRVIALFFLLGTLFIQFFPALPPLGSVYILFIASLFLMWLPRKLQSHNSKTTKNLQILSIIICAFLSGLFVATYAADKQLQSRLAKHLEGKDLIVQGKIIDIPNVRENGLRFRFEISSAQLASEEPEDNPKRNISQKLNLQGIIRLGWYQNKQEIHAGETWQLRVRLKQPSGFMNDGGFDYEKWLFTERIVATGYVRKSKVHENQRLKESVWWSPNHLRESIHQTIQNKVEDKASAAVLSALVVAIRTNLDDQQWKQLQQTGTSHLVAISGLHIAVVAGFAFLPIMLIWGIFPGLNERIPLRIAGGVTAVLFAGAYALLAGFTLPTQRALLMVIIAMLGLVSRKNYEPSTVLAGALLAVLLLDPLSGMTVSFWLSFLAVALILIFLKRQIIKPRFQLIKLQMLLSLAMFPLTLLFFGSASLISPLANFFAIPWVSFIIVPLSLIALMIMPFSSYISEGIFSMAALAINWLFNFLNVLNQSSLANFTSAGIPGLYLLIAFCGLLFLLLPKGFPAKWLGLIAFLPALFFTVETPKKGEFTYTLLDVGQGMASVIQTRTHTLVYDAGTRVSSTFDIGKLVVIPYLQSKNIKAINHLIVSHEDIDHRGGAKSINESIKLEKAMSSDTTLSLSDVEITQCQQGQAWQWDGVNFEILSPPANYQQNDNNRSCVLRVSNAHYSLLITGDIQKKAEKLLLQNEEKKLSANVMTMPHHGSKTSSSIDFIRAVSPDIVLIPAGYRNRFGHPKQEVINRYKSIGTRLLDTVSFGAIEVTFSENKVYGIRTKSYRLDNKGFWSRE